MAQIKEQQQAVVESFVKHIREALRPRLQTRRVQLSQAAASWDLAVGAATDLPPHASRGGVDDQKVMKEEQERDRAKWTLTRSDHLLMDIKARIAELETLRQNALNTSSGVSFIIEVLT